MQNAEKTHPTAQISGGPRLDTRLTSQPIGSRIARGTLFPATGTTPSQAGRILGVVHVATYEREVDCGRNLDGAQPVGRNGAFVYERPAHTGKHNFLQPAQLPDEFFVPSTLLESGENTETWKTDKRLEGNSQFFPNLDIIIANVQDSPRSFVKCFVDHGWPTNETIICPLASVMQQHLQRLEVQTRINENPEGKDILVFDALLSLAQFIEGRKRSTLCIGCPVLPHQLLASIQAQVAGHVLYKREQAGERRQQSSQCRSLERSCKLRTWPEVWRARSCYAKGRTGVKCVISQVRAATMVQGCKARGRPVVVGLQ